MKTALLKHYNKMPFILISIFLIFIFLGPYLSPFHYDTPDFSHALESPSIATKHFFGTDSLGFDLFSRVLIGTKITIMIAILSTIVNVCIGVSFGTISGYIGGKTDVFMMRIVDILYAIPFIFLVILLMAVFHRSIFLLFLAIGAVSWLDISRITRGQTLSIKNKDYIKIATTFGSKTPAIIWHHILPNLRNITAGF